MIGVNDIEITVAICTQNWGRIIGATLTALLAQTRDHNKFQVAVIDNGSTDNTADVARLSKAKFPQFLYIVEPRLGLPFARNRGWRSVCERIVACLDDGAVVESTWLECLEAAAISKVIASFFVVFVGQRIFRFWAVCFPFNSSVLQQRIER